VDKADGNDSGRVMAALSDAAVIDVTAADQSRVKVGCRTRGNHVKMPWQRRLLRVEVRNPSVGGLQ
jgi:hypothetical protein